MSAERQAVLQDLGDNVDRLCTLDLRPPGPTSGYIGRFYQAVRVLTNAPLTLAAAQCLHQITPQSTIAIATGFCHPERLPYGETDGLLGAASLARAVRRGLACRSSLARQLLRHLYRPVSRVWVYISTESSRQHARTPAASPFRPSQPRRQRHRQRRSNS